MGYLSERISYIKGLADGLDLGEESKEAKVLSAIIELLDDMTFAVEELEEQQDLINEDLDDLDEIVGELEEYVYDDCDCDCCDCDDCDCDGIDFEDVTCPACGAEIELDDDIISDDCSYFICPECNEKIDIDWTCDFDCYDDDCECGCCDCDEE